MTATQTHDGRTAAEIDATLEHLNAHHPDTVAADGPDGPADVGAVAVVTAIRIAAVKDAAVVVPEVPSVNVIHEAITVVVDSVDGGVSGIGSDVGGEVGMIEVDPLIDDADIDSG